MNLIQPWSVTLVGPQLSAPMPVLDGSPDGEATPHLGALLAVLIFRAGGPAGHVAVRQPTVRIGREGGNDIVLAVPSVSAAHAELRLRGGVWTLTDLGSMHGSWVDGEPVFGSVPLGPGSAIRLGEVELVFSPKDRWEDSPTERVHEPLLVAPDPGPPLPAPRLSAGMVDRPTRFVDDPPSFVLPEPRRRVGPLLFFVAVAVAVAVVVFLLRQAS